MTYFKKGYSNSKYLPSSAIQKQVDLWEKDKCEEIERKGGVVLVTFRCGETIRFKVSVILNEWRKIYGRFLPKQYKKVMRMLEKRWDK